MRSRVLAFLVAVGLVITGLVGQASTASASTGGVDDTANQYSNVGILVFYEGGERFRCSGPLVTPTVVLTAAHCASGVSGLTAVSFSAEIAEAAPAPFPVAADPTAGYTRSELSNYLYGTALAHPQYSDFTDMSNWNDVGVVVLSRAVKGVTPAKVATSRTLDAYSGSRLASTLFRAVGYGTRVAKPDAGPQKAQPVSYPLVRRYVDEPGQKLTGQILQTNGNENDTRGTGGTCFGDSGGPLLLNGRIVAVVSYGYTDNCRYLAGNQRVEIPVVQDWLSQFGVKP